MNININMSMNICNTDINCRGQYLQRHHHITEQHKPRHVFPSSSDSILPFQSSTRLNALPPAASVAAVATATATATATTIGPAVVQRVCFLLHSDPVFVLSAVLLLSTFGITLERRTTIGKALSAPLATMALALIVANFGIIPISSPIYDIINRSLVPLAVPLLLFDSDLRRVLSSTGTLLLAFLLGAISTVVGTLIAYTLVPLRALGPHDGWRVGAALAARHIGGAINFVAVAETLSVGGTAVSAAIAADNVVVALYFGVLFYLAKAGDVDVDVDVDVDDGGMLGGEEEEEEEEEDGGEVV